MCVCVCVCVSAVIYIYQQIYLSFDVKLCISVTYILLYMTEKRKKVR